MIYCGFDFITAAGAPQTVVDRTFTINHTANVLTLEFKHSGAGRPHVNGIAVVYAGALPAGHIKLTGGIAVNGISTRWYPPRG
jgi:hypothetical protein